MNFHISAYLNYFVFPCHCMQDKRSAMIMITLASKESVE